MNNPSGPDVINPKVLISERGSRGLKATEGGVTVEPEVGAMPLLEGTMSQGTWGL